MTEDEEQQLEDVATELGFLRDLLDVIEEGDMRGTSRAEITRHVSLAIVGKRVLDRAQVHLRKVLVPATGEQVTAAPAGRAIPQMGGE